MIVRLNPDVQVIPDPESDGALLVNDAFIVARVNKTGKIILELAEQQETWEGAAREFANVAICSPEYAATTIREYTAELARAGWLEQQNLE
jgi:hypothetical protein